MHGVNDAPQSTIDHYNIPGGTGHDAEKTKKPSDSAKFWAVMEEVDAAIGAVMEELKTRNILNDTVVMMTSDQGRPSSGFGAPALRDGKGSTYEGGLRVGMLAWVPDAGEGTAGRGKKLDASYVGSQADVFQTVVDAAGCQPTYSSTGLYDAGYCVGKKGVPCKSSSDCGGGTCQAYTLSGKSLLPILRGVSTAPVARNASYARYLGSPKIVATRKGYITDGTLTAIEALDTSGSSADDEEDAKVSTCGVSVNEEASAADPASLSTDIIRTAGSCWTCKTNSDCTADDPDVSGEKLPCVSNGQYCVPSGDTDECLADGLDASSCAVAKLSDLRQCSAAEPCTGNDRCMHIEVPCQTCGDAEWKFAGNGGDGSGSGANITAAYLYDLSTNPEELDKPEPKKSSTTRLNCLYAPTGATGTYRYKNKVRLSAIANHLCERLDLWTDCVIDRDGSCDFLVPDDIVASTAQLPDISKLSTGFCNARPCVS